MMDEPIEPTTPAEPGSTPPEPKTTGVTFSQEQQDYLNSLLKKERLDAKKQAQKEFDAVQQQAKESAEAEKLKEQNEWQKLAETHEAKAKELEPQVTTLSEKVATYEAVITDLLTAKIKALGDVAKKAVENLPGAPDALAKLQWLNTNENLFKPLGPGNQIKPKPAATTPQEPVARPIVRL